MYRTLRYCFALLILFSSGFPVLAQTFIAGTFNIRLETESDTGNLWTARAPLVSALIRFHRFDVFGTQEGFRNQLDDIQRTLPEFDYYGAGRDDGREKGEHSAVFYRKDRFRLLAKGDFWLSETPEKPSKGWDGRCCNRICTWVYLKDQRSGKSFYFFNAHFDHEGVTARKESSRLILERISRIAGKNPVIFSGDLNGDHESEWYLTVARSGILKDSYGQVNFPYTDNGSFNGFGKTLESNRIIDHIFTSSQFEVSRWGILPDSFHGKFPSDHFPVLAEVNLK